MTCRYLALYCLTALFGVCASASAQSDGAPAQSEKPTLACDSESAKKRLSAIPAAEFERRAAEIEPEVRAKNAGASDEFVKAKSADIARLEAQIRLERECYSQRPWRKAVGVKPAAPRFTRYVADWSRVIERTAALHITPQLAEKLGGHRLVVSVAVKRDGEVETLEIESSSGDATVDDFAKRLVRLAAPFPPFPNEIRVDTDILLITRTWDFLPRKKAEASSLSIQ